MSGEFPNRAAPQCELITLGRLTMLTPAGVPEDLVKRRRKLALLVLLSLSPKPLTRDTLVDMFWGEEPDERARHSLSDALSHLRRVLGKDAISSGQAEIELSANAPLVVDAREFAAACQAGDWARALATYTGPFLDGVIIDRSPRFEQWSSHVRVRLERLFTRACDARCTELEGQSDWDACAEVAERWLDAAPGSADAARMLMNARKAAATPDALREALAVYDRVVRYLASEMNETPDKSLVDAANDIRSALASMKVDVVVPAPPGPTVVMDVPPVAAPAKRRVRLIFAAAAAMVVALVTSAVVVRARTAEAPVSTQPVVVVTNIQNTLSDTSLAWLGEGLRQMLAADLDRSGRLAVVPPVRLRDAMARRHGAGGEQDELQLARDLGATWAVRGGITRGDGIYVLDLTVSDTKSGRPISTFSVTGASLIGVADQAGARIRSLVSESSTGPYFADIETRSIEALHHYVRAQQLGAEDRLAEKAKELDAAIALDSTFPSAIMDRLRMERGGRSPTVVRLARLYEEAKPRLSDWDRLEQETYYAFHNGEHRRAEELGAELVRRYPFDPRAYITLTSVLNHHGKWRESDAVFRRLLALDSIAVSRGDGPCVPCSAYSGLIGVREFAGDFAGADSLSRRWIALQPDVVSAWEELSTAQEFQGRFDAALVSARRAIALSDGPGDLIRVGRVLIAARRYAEADSVIRGLARLAPAYNEGAFDLRVTLLRERGQHRAALALVDASRDGDANELLAAQTYALIGQPRRSMDRFLRMKQPPGAAPEPISPVMSVTGDFARAESWHRALFADAIWETDDTVHLRALADTLQQVSARSYYGRDWVLHHHVRGLIALRAGRYDEAMHELSLARWGVAGWTRTLAAYADAAIAAGRPADALPALRDAYRGTLDAMGRYEPRSEFDYRMAVVFHALGQRDSAGVYASYVKRAWRDADPEWKQRVVKLDGLLATAGPTK
jgi:DNA-binding SARP family transcriptional activator/TolB-like protein